MHSIFVSLDVGPFYYYCENVDIEFYNKMPQLVTYDMILHVDPLQVLYMNGRSKQSKLLTISVDVC